MCGIAGFVDFSAQLSSEVLDNTISRLAHRGPDDQGTYFKHEEGYSLGLGNRRLSIIDLSDKGHQPFISPCGNFILVFNGIIYNFRELREELSRSGRQFVSLSDTEVLLSAYIEWPGDFLKKLNGIFAFAIYDRVRQKLVLARDRMGVKPLFYSFDGTRLKFGSELRAIPERRIIRSQISPLGLNLYLQYGYFPAPYTILNDVWKVLPAEVISICLQSKKLNKNVYWNINNPAEIIPGDTDIQTTTQRLLEHSVSSRLVSDVPFGILLSGGFDSSVTAAIAQRNSTEPIKTFTVGFKDNDYDESLFAERIAKHIGSEHHRVYFDQQNMAELISACGRIFDEPMGDSGAIPVLLAAKLAKPQVKVLLSAEGGDELFGGYPNYFKALKISRLTRHLPFPKGEKSNRFLNIFSQKTALNGYQAIFKFHTAKEAALLTGLEHVPEYKSLVGDPLNSILLFDQQNYLPESLLMKADRSMMHFGIENRDPLLDYKLVEYVNSLSGNTKCPGGNAKQLLKQIAYQYIPQHLLDRPKKGFSIPVSKWLSEDLRDFTKEKIDNLASRSILNGQSIDITYRSFVKTPKSYRSRQVWLFLALELWLQEWVD